MRKRRSEIEIWRDILLTLFHNRKAMKKTPLMFATGLTWGSLCAVIRFFEDRKIIRTLHYRDLSRSERNRLELDSRSREAIEITEKGKNVLRFIDGFLRYVNEGGSDTLPRWMLQKIFRNPIIPLGEPYTKLFPGIGSSDLWCFGWISNPKIEGPIHCPLCGKKMKNRQGLRSHAGVKHRAQFDLIMSLFEEYAHIGS